jgi:hypothetical protein
LSIKLDLRKTLGSLFLLLAAPLLVATSPAAPAPQQEKESYSIGYQVGRSMTADGVQVNIADARTLISQFTNPGGAECLPAPV